VLNGTLRLNPIGLVVTALVALGAGLVLAYQKSETFRNIVDAAFGAIKTSAGNMVGALVQGFRGILTVWLTVADGIISGAAKALGWVPGLGGKLKAANAAFDEMKTGILKTLDGVADAAYGIGENVAKGVAQGIQAKQSVAIQAAARMAGAVISGTNARLIIDSPSKVMAESGGFVAAGLAQGIDRNARLAATAASELAQGVIDAGNVQMPSVAATLIGTRGDTTVAGGGHATTNINVHLTVQGSVTAERDLIASVRNGLAEVMRNNGGSLRYAM
jgi:hypothetical protein